MEATIASEFAATGSPSTRWFQGLLAGNTGHFGAPGTRWAPAAVTAASAPVAAIAAMVLSRPMPGEGSRPLCSAAMTEREESDQLPEEGPEQQVPEDDSDESRDSAEDQAG